MRPPGLQVGSLAALLVVLGLAVSVCGDRAYEGASLPPQSLGFAFRVPDAHHLAAELGDAAELGAEDVRCMTPLHPFVTGDSQPSPAPSPYQVDKL